MIYPCKCNGNMKYVHLNCLNTWRKTIPSRNDECEICKYKFKISSPHFYQFFDTYLHNSISIQFIHIFIIFILSTILFGSDSNRFIASSIIGDSNNITYYRIYYILSFFIIFIINILIVATNIGSLSSKNKKIYFKSFIKDNSFKYILFILISLICILYYYIFYDSGIYIDIIYSILLNDMFNRTHIYNLNYIDNNEDEYILNYE